MRRTLTVLTALLGSAGPSSAQPRWPAEQVHAAPATSRASTTQAMLVPGQLLVRLQPGAVLPAPGGAPQAVAPPVLPALQLGGVPVQLLSELTPTRDAGGALVLLRTAAQTEEGTRQALAQITGDPRVRYADPDLMLWAAGVPDDPLYPKQWNLAQIHAAGGWDHSTGSDAVVVAVLDTGVLPHPDLAPRLLPGYDFILDPALAQDGDGRDSDPSDPGVLLHGTHVAGIIGASTNNQHGIAGLDWACRVLPVRVLAPSAEGQLGGRISDLIPALRWAAGKEVPGVAPAPRAAQVINLSLGARTTQEQTTQALRETLVEVHAAGVVVIAAAGNDHADAAAYVPAGLPHVIAVGATSARGSWASYSNFGAAVALLAPGGQDAASGVVSTHFARTAPAGAEPAGGVYTYSPLSGTSQAAPHVAAGAALLLAQEPLLPSALAQRLRASTQPQTNCQPNAEQRCEVGILDMERLLSQSGCQMATRGPVRTALGPLSLWILLLISLAFARGRRKPSAAAGLP